MESERTNEVGIIYTSETADSTYGSSLTKLNINSSVLSSIVSGAGQYIMFYLKDGELIIADQDRKSLHPQDSQFSPDTVFHYFSTSKVNELLKLGNASETTIEQRRDVLTLSNGNYTLENAKPCPPYCP